MKTLVLIIEDDAQVAKFYEAALLSDDYECETVKTLEQAHARLRDRSRRWIGVIILDLILPNGKGVQLVDMFTNEHSKIPLVVVTAMPVSVEDVITAGAESVLFKGQFEIRELLRAVKESFWRHKVRGEFMPIERESKIISESMRTYEKRLEEMETKLREPAGSSAAG